MGKYVPWAHINVIYFHLINIYWVQSLFFTIKPITLCTVCVCVCVCVCVSVSGVKVSFSIVGGWVYNPWRVPATLLGSRCVRARVRTRTYHHVVSSPIEAVVDLVAGQGNQHYVIK